MQICSKLEIILTFSRKCLFYRIFTLPKFTLHYTFYGRKKKTNNFKKRIYCSMKDWTWCPQWHTNLRLSLCTREQRWKPGTSVQTHDIVYHGTTLEAKHSSTNSRRSLCTREQRCKPSTAVQAQRWPAAASYPENTKDPGVGRFEWRRGVRRFF